MRSRSRGIGLKITLVLPVREALAYEQHVIGVLIGRLIVGLEQLVPFTADPRLVQQQLLRLIAAARFHNLLRCDLA